MQQAEHAEAHLVRRQQQLSDVTERVEDESQRVLESDQDSGTFTSAQSECSNFPQESDIFSSDDVESRTAKHHRDSLPMPDMLSRTDNSLRRRTTAAVTNKQSRNLKLLLVSVFICIVAGVSI